MLTKKPFSRVSFLIFPALEEKYVKTAIRTKASGLIFDLEDAISSTHKEKARKACVRWLDKYKDSFLGKEVVVRINSMSSKAGEDDVQFLLDSGVEVDTLMLPKTGTANQVARLEKLLDGYENRRGRNIGLILILETLPGIANADRILSKGRRVNGVIVGEDDLSARFLTYRRPIYECPLLLYAISRVAFTAYSRNIDLLAGVYPYISPIQDSILRQECGFLKQLGVIGRVAIHPSQIKLINECFEITKEQVREAEEVLNALQQAGRTGLTIMRHNDRAWGAPGIIFAKNTLYAAYRQGSLKKVDLQNVDKICRQLSGDGGKDINENSL